MKTKIISIMMALTVLVMVRCTDVDPLVNVESYNASPLALRSAFDNYFDWQNIYEVKMNKGDGTVVTKRLPWNFGISSAVPDDWKDRYVESGDLSQKMYTQLNHWELIYSNINENTPFKYIGMYNKVTGKLRFFTMIFAEPGAFGSSESMWVIGIDKPTSMFDFQNGIAWGMGGKYSEGIGPAFATTPIGSLTSNGFRGAVGMQTETWYAFEVECSYDANLTVNDSHLLKISGTAVNKIIYTGDINTLGTAKGTITNFNTNSGLTLNISDMFNQSQSNTYSIKGVDAAKKIGEDIDKKIAAKDSFFVSLWNNIKNNASSWISSGLESGAKKGLEAIFSSGGSVIGESLGGLFNSLIGRNKPSISEVNLQIKLQSDIKLEGYGEYASFPIHDMPIPQVSTNPNFKPLYNKPLGVWNLSKTPTIDIYHYKYVGINSKSYEYEKYSLLNSEAKIILNPAIANEYQIKNSAIELMIPYRLGVNKVYKLNYYLSSSNQVLLNENPYYVIESPSKSIETINYNLGMLPTFGVSGREFLVRVKFSLVDKSTQEVISDVVKYFNVAPGKKTSYTEYEPPKETPGPEIIM